MNNNFIYINLPTVSMNTSKTQEEKEVEKKNLKFFLNYRVNPYDEIIIDDDITYYKQVLDESQSYYIVNKIKMNVEEYQHYLDNKFLNNKLSNKLKHKDKIKHIKI